jgi:acyl-CoA thioesterase
MTQDAVDDLCELLDLEPIEVNIFRGVSPDDDRQRVFGGQVAGQALVAAARTVDAGRPVHSLHAYFLRPGDPSVPILRGGPHPGRPVVHDATGRGHPARARHLQPGRVVPRPRAGTRPPTARARRARADEPADLDHAMWFHRPFRADEWLLYDEETPSASGALGLARGSIFTADGDLAISVVQEGLIRLLR